MNMTRKTSSDNCAETRSDRTLTERPAPEGVASVDRPVGHRTNGLAGEDSTESGLAQLVDDGSPSRPVRIPGHPRAVSPRKDKTRKVHSLIDKVYNWDNLYWAWRRVRRNKGVHGLDKVSIHMFEANWPVHLREIQRHLIENRYKPLPVRRVYIPKSSDPDKKRPLGIPAVKDRIVQQAIVQQAEPRFDDEMSERSFGYRKGRKAHDAIATIRDDASEGYRYVFDADISRFFDTIDHDVVMSRVRARIADGRVLNLIEGFLKAGVWEDGKITVPTRGVPQGGVISPWLSNLVLDDLDKAIESSGYRHVRYADDFVVLCKSREESVAARDHVKEVLDALNLSLHETKTRLTDFSEGFEFLGFRFRGSHIGISDRATVRLKERVRHVTRRQQGRNLDSVIQKLNPVLRGWVNYFGVAEVTKRLRLLDSWMRMRVRSFRFKRKCRRHNLKLSTGKLEQWGLLSLTLCRPVLRLSHVPGPSDPRERAAAPCYEAPTRGRPVR